jgi:hypothetical protein
MEAPPGSAAPSPALYLGTPGPAGGRIDASIFVANSGVVEKQAGSAACDL